MLALGARGVMRDAPPETPFAFSGAGGTTLAESARAPELRLPPETFGGGGTTFAARPPVDARFEEETPGGGGTTSCGPKILPMMLLTNEGDWLGGGGTTLGEAAALPLSRRRRS